MGRKRPGMVRNGEMDLLEVVDPPQNVTLRCCYFLKEIFTI